MQAPGALPGDVVEMRRVAANHTAQRYDGIVPTACGELARDDGDLECARHACDEQVIGSATPFQPRRRGALEQACDDEVVEACRHDRNLAVASGEFTFHDAGRVHWSFG